MPRSGPPSSPVIVLPTAHVRASGQTRKVAPGAGCLEQLAPPCMLGSRVVLFSNQQSRPCVCLKQTTPSCLAAMSCSKAARASTGTKGSPRAGTPPTPRGGPSRGSAEHRSSRGASKGGPRQSANNWWADLRGLRFHVASFGLCNVEAVARQSLCPLEGLADVV